MDLDYSLSDCLLENMKYLFYFFPFFSFFFGFFLGFSLFMATVLALDLNPP